MASNSGKDEESKTTPQQAPMSEADQAMLRMFGTDEEQKMTPMERQKMKLVAAGYKDSTVFFKMFFDKWYRRPRYDAIVNRIDDFNNINEFRTFIMHNYASMPKAPSQNLYIIKPAVKEGQKLDPSQVSDTDQRDNNVLLERQYLSTYWLYFRVSLCVQFMLAGLVTYGVGSIAVGKFSGVVMRTACGVGIVTHLYAMYLKRVKMDNYQQQIEPLYAKQVQAYERFVSDDFHNRQ